MGIITANHPGQKVSVKTTRTTVRVIIADSREGNIVRKVELLGRLVIPMPVKVGKIIVNFRFDELKNPLKGVVCDIQFGGCNIVFPIMHPNDAVATDGKYLSLDEVKQLFLKYHPELKEVA
jgi:hypothetical protein